MNLFNWLMFGLFIGFLIIVGLWQNRRVASQNQYLLAGRNTSLIALIATLVMTEFNTATLLAFSATGYTASWWGLSLGLVFLCGLLFYAFVVAKRWKRFNGISVAHFFSERYGNKIGYFVAVVLFFAMLGFSAVYIKSVVLLFSPLFPHVSVWLISAVIVVVIFAMILRGGLLAIIRTDLVSFGLLIIFFPALIYFANKLPVTASASVSFATMQQALPPRFVISLIFLTMFSYILAPWYGQKVVAAKSTRVAFLAVACAALIIAILYSSGIIAVAILKSKGVVLTNPELAIPYLVSHALPSYVKGIAFAVLFCIGATTLAGVWSAMVTLIVGEMSDRRSLNYSYVFTLLCAVAAYLCANLLTSSILNAMILANIPIVALSFALLAGFYWRKASALSVYCSVSVGIVWAVFCYLHYGQPFYTWYWAVYGIPLVFIVGYSVVKISNRFKLNNNIQLDEFLG